VDVDTLRIHVRRAEPEWMDGRRVQGDTKSEAGTRTVILPAFLRRELRWHLDSYAEPGPDGFLFVGEKGAPFRRSIFGRKWRRARKIVGMPEGFRFYDLRHTGHTLSTRSGATLKDTMVRAGQSSEKAALIYQHSDEERQEEVRSPPASTRPSGRLGPQLRGRPPRDVLARIWHAAGDHRSQQQGPGL
jgi:integrase